MRQLKIWIEPIWSNFNVKYNIFTHILSKSYNLIFDQTDPEIVIGNNPRYNRAKTIYFHGEPVYGRWDFNYSLVPFYDIPDDRQIRFPLYLYYLYDFLLDGTIDSFDYFFRKRNRSENKTNFCNFICGGPQDGYEQFRDIFFKKLNKYKKIDCPGSRYNNMARLEGGSHDGLEASRIKRRFIRENNYKFTLSFENTSEKDGYYGYTSEKLLDAMVSNTLPIYWGNIHIDREFNTKSFINYHDYKSDDEVIEKIIELDNDEELYNSYMIEPLTLYNDYLNEDFLVEIFEKIINS